jgi:HK97 family phage major capsid protein
MGGGVPGTMYEYPYFVSEAFPTATGVVDLQPYILFADLKNYALGRRVGFTSLQVDRSIKFLEGQVIFKIETRFAGAPKIDAAFSFIRDV